MASCDFIDFILKDNDFLKLDGDDKKNLSTIRGCYSELKRLSNEMVKVIGEYKEAFTELFADEEFIPIEHRHEISEIDIEN